MSRKLAFSIKMKDLVVQTFRAGGPGGQNQNKRDTGVRLTHPASGAVAESREERTQLENKRKALLKLGRDPKFQRWCRVFALQVDPVDEMVHQLMRPTNIKTEVRDGNRWVESNTLSS